MTPEKVIELAKQAGLKQRHNSPIEWWMVTDDIQAFAQLVRNAVIEEAKVSLLEAGYKSTGVPAFESLAERIERLKS